MVVTYDTMRVLRFFLCAEGEPRCGSELIRELRMASGTVYPMLARLKTVGWIDFVESLPAPDAPTSHFYRLSDAGRVAFLERLARLTIPNNLWREQSRAATA